MERDTCREKEEKKLVCYDNFRHKYDSQEWNKYGYEIPAFLVYDVETINVPYTPEDGSATETNKKQFRNYAVTRYRCAWRICIKVIL